MRNWMGYVAVLGLFLSSSIAFPAAGGKETTAGKVTIVSPTEGAVVDSRQAFELSYEADPGPNGDHLHLNVDGKRVDVIRQLKGTEEVGPLSPGKHTVCLAVNTASHVPTGVEECINVTSR